MEASPTAVRRDLRHTPLLSRAPTWLVATVVGSVAAGLLAGDWIAGVALWVLWAGWRYLRPDEGLPVLAMAFTFQWVQVTVGIYYFAVTGDPLQAMDAPDYRLMVVIGLGWLLALLVGLRAGMWITERLGVRPSAGPERAFSWQALLFLYVVSVIVTGPVQELAWRFPGLTQGVLALTYARFALLFLLFRRVSHSPTSWLWIAVFLAGEIVLGFTGYFAGFREPIMLAATALVGVFDRRQVKHWLIVGTLATVALMAGILWMGIRKEFRKDFASDVFAQSREARLERITALATAWTEQGVDEMLSDVQVFMDRLWAIYYPALALGRVPALVPHENGAILRRAVRHLLTPRLFFPDKPTLESDSEMVLKYAGVLVAGAGPLSVGEEGETSVAFGCAGESYVDFGIPLMFLPILVYGLLMGVVYRWLLALIWYRELGVALATVTFWLSLYQFEISWIKMLGGSLTLVLYLGGFTVLLDRFLRRHRRGRAGIGPPPAGRSHASAPARRGVVESGSRTGSRNAESWRISP